MRGLLCRRLNRAVVRFALVTMLPVLAVVERARPGRGRVMALRGAGRLGRFCGVEFQTRGAHHLASASSSILVANHSRPIVDALSAEASRQPNPVR